MTQSAHSAPSKSRVRKAGFTIVEVTIALAFIAILMVSIATLILRITKMYQKGLTLKALNSTGTEIIEDISRTISSGSYLVNFNSADINRDGYLNVYESNESYYEYFFEFPAKNLGKVLEPKTDADGNPVNDAAGHPIYVINDTLNADVNQNKWNQDFGVFCTGNYSYVWNTARALNEADKREPTPTSPVSSTAEPPPVRYIVIKNIKDPQNPNKPYVPRLMRLYDPHRDLCGYANGRLVPSISSSETAMTVNTPINAGDKLTFAAPSSSSGDPSERLWGKYGDIPIWIRDRENRVLENFDLGEAPTSTTGVSNLNYAIELIHDNESDLALYEFKVFPVSQGAVTRQTYATLSFILATKRGGVNIKANGDFCRGEGLDESESATEFNLYDFDYCAVNKFNFSVRSGGDFTKGSN